MGCGGECELADLIVFKLQDFSFQCYITLKKCLHSNFSGTKKEVAAFSYGTARNRYSISSHVDIN